jgi:hypothetical protein
MKKELIVFFIGLFLIISVSYPSIYLPDEWITANQLNHLVQGKDPLYGFEPYGGLKYGIGYSNVLVYTLALPVFAYPTYQVLLYFHDTFRLIIILSAFLSMFLAVLMIELWFRKYSHWNGIPWASLVGILSIGFMILNLFFYRSFAFDQYGEVAALIFTNHIAFAFLMVLVFVIFKEIFGSDIWGIFGVVAIIASSSYLFWAGTAKDHMLTFLFMAIMALFFILYIKQKNLLFLISCYISVGWLAWVRPELGLSIFLGVLLCTILFSVRNGIKSLVLSFVCSLALFLGALPLFINNYGLTGNPLKLPGMLLYTTQGNNGSVVTGAIAIIAAQFQQSRPGFVNGLASFFGIFVKPASVISSGIFQVSPLSAFGCILIAIILLHLFKKIDNPLWLNKEKEIVVFAGIMIFSVFLAYVPDFFWISNSFGIIPDLRYLAPIYLPLIILGFFALKKVDFSDECILVTLTSFIPLVIIELPLLYLVFQLFSENSLPGQLMINLIITYAILIVSLVVFLLVLTRKTDIRNLAFSLAAVMVSSLSWTLIVDFRFRVIGYEGYPFWLPIIEKIWIAQMGIISVIPIIKFV